MSLAVRWLLLVAIMATAIGPTQFAAAQTQPSGAAQSTIYPSDWAPPRTVYIPETGHSIDGWFLDLWRESGGYGSFGYPITPEMTANDGHIYQYYDYARFEYWPNGDANGNLLTIGKIGRELRPQVIPRVAIGGQNAKSAQVTQAALAWEPLAQDAIATDSAAYRYFSETGHSVADEFKSYWERTGEQWYLGFPVTEPFAIDGVRYQIFEKGKIQHAPGRDIELIPVGRVLAERYQLSQAPQPQGNLPIYSESLFIPPAPPTVTEIVSSRGADPNAERWLEINLTTQYMIAWQGDVPILETYVSTGKAGFDTPPGTYFVNTKIPVQDMAGVLGGEYYDVKDVPHVMYFTNRGHAIHGAYWHNNFGTPMSHGCINLPLDVAEFIYDWASVGLRVDIHF